jgi:hypothetical protein
MWFISPFMASKQDCRALRWRCLLEGCAPLLQPLGESKFAQIALKFKTCCNSLRCEFRFCKYNTVCP